MNLERKSKNSIIRKAFYGLFIMLTVACTTKKEVEPVKETIAPVAIEKTAVVRETTEILDIVTYGVQIGAYKKFDVQFESSVKNIKNKGLSNYVLGDFKTKKEAENFLKIIKDLSIKDAFVVTIKDGEIIK